MEHSERYRLDREILPNSDTHTAGREEKKQTTKNPNKYRNKNRNIH